MQTSSKQKMPIVAVAVIGRRVWLMRSQQHSLLSAHSLPNKPISCLKHAPPPPARHKACQRCCSVCSSPCRTISSSCAHSPMTLQRNCSFYCTPVSILWMKNVRNLAHSPLPVLLTMVNHKRSNNFGSGHCPQGSHRQS